MHGDGHVVRVIRVAGRGAHDLGQASVGYAQRAEPRVTRRVYAARSEMCMYACLLVLLAGVHVHARYFTGDVTAVPHARKALYRGVITEHGAIDVGT